MENNQHTLEDQLEIVEIIQRSKQGATLPFVCRGEDDNLYFVKGKSAGRKSLIAEYVCGCLAKNFGLPVADFKIVNVPDALIENALIPDIHELGVGLAFGSKSVKYVQEIQYSQIKKVDLKIRKDILVFDWWVQNGDRILTENGGNPNLLWDQQSKQIVVIDHNIAFEEPFDCAFFQNSHIFQDLIPVVFEDWVDRYEYTNRLDVAFAELDKICNNVPPEWWYVDDGVPASLNADMIKGILSSFKQDCFWEVKI